MTDPNQVPPTYDPRVVYVQRQNHPKAIHAIIAAAVAYLVCPVIPAIFALMWAREAERGIAESGGLYDGQGLVTAARVLSWLHLAGAAVGLLVVIGLSFAGTARAGA